MGFIEPKPGIEPTASHTAELISTVKTLGVKFIGKEPFYSDKAPKVIAAATGATVRQPPAVRRRGRREPIIISLFSISLLDAIKLSAMGQKR